MGPNCTKVIPDYSEIRVKSEHVEAVLSNTDNKGINEESTLLTENNLSYATVAKNPPKAENGVFEYTAETRARVFETYKDDYDFLWFERQFPDVQSSVPLTKTQMSENFDIAEEFIREEMEQDKIRKGKKRSAM